MANLIKYIADEAERQSFALPIYYMNLKPPPVEGVGELVRYCKNENLSLIVGCDSDAHHTVWGCSNCNGRGASLYEFLNTTNLEIIN